MSLTPPDYERRSQTPAELSGRRYQSEEDDDDSANEETPLTRHPDSLPVHSVSTTKHNPWTTFRTRLRYYVPVFSWLPSYTLDTFWGDFFAGLTVTAVLLPGGLSYSVLAKVPPVHGLYTIVVPGLVYPFLGTSRQMSIGPEALVAMLVGSSVVQQQKYIGRDDPESAVLIASLVTSFVGILTLLLGLIRLGFLDSILSRPLLRGFITAVAVVIIIEQSITMLGLTDQAAIGGITHASSTVEKFIFIVTHLEYVHYLTVAVSLASFVFVLTFRFIKHKFSRVLFLQFVPEILICVVISTYLCGLFQWDREGLRVLGVINGRGFPKFSIPKPLQFSHIIDCFETAILISIVGFVESIVVTKTYATKHNYAVSPNRELVALGAANLIGSCFQCFPSYGGMARSRINDRAGARTQFSGLVTAVFVILCLFFALPLFHYLPTATLGSIICVAALSLLSETPHDMKFMYKIKAWIDLVLLLLTFFVTIFVSIEYGTLISVGLSLVMVVKHSTYPRITILGRVGNSGRFKRIKDFPDQAELVEGLLVVKIEEPLYFANTGQLKDRLRRLEEFGDMSVHPSEDSRMSPIRNVIFDIETMEDLDASAALILVEIVEAYHQRGVNVFFVKLRENQKKAFVRAGLFDKVGADHFFRRIADALDYINYHENRSELNFSDS